MKRISLWFIVLLLISIQSCSKNDSKSVSKDKEMSATVSFMVGDVKVDTSGAISNAAVDMLLSKGSTVMTGKRSECNLLIGSDSYILVKENSKLVIERLAKSMEGLENNSVELKMGRVVVNPKKLLKDEEFKVKTPTAIAAVRGTKFVVSQEEGKSVSIAVVEGKVEMKPRVEAIENIDQSKANKEVVAEIQKKIDENAVIIEQNQTASFDVKKSEMLNKKVEQVIKETAVAPKTEDNKKDAESTAKKEAIPDFTAVIASATKTIEKAEIVKQDVVAKKVMLEVKDLDQKIADDKKKKEEAAKPSAKLTVVSPAKDGVISVNGKKIGRGQVSLKVDAGVSLKIEITARDFEQFSEELTLAKDEEKTLEAVLVKSKLLDRLGWAANVGNIKGDLLFFNDRIIASTSQGNVVLMNNSGAQIWTAHLAGGIDSTPAISDGRLYVVTKNENLYALDISNGKVLWTAKVGGALVFGSSPRVVEKSVIVAASNGKIKSFSKDGKELWTSDIGSGIYSSPSFSDGKIFVGADDQKLYALSTKKGSTEWDTKLDGRVVSSSPVIHDGKIFLGSFKGTLYSISMSNGKVEWTAKTGGAIVSSPVINGKVICIGSKDSKVYALDISSGKSLWTFRASEPVTSEVVFKNNQVYVLSGKTVYALNPKNGEAAWSYGLADIGSSIIADNKDIYVGTSGGLFALRVDLKDIVK